MSYYCASDHELDMLERGNTVSRWSVSTGWSLLTLAIGLCYSYLTEQNPSDVSKRVLFWLFPTYLVLAGLCFGVWYFTKGERGRLIEWIKATSEEES